MWIKPVDSFHFISNLRNMHSYFYSSKSKSNLEFLAENIIAFFSFYCFSSCLDHLVSSSRIFFRALMSIRLKTLKYSYNKYPPCSNNSFFSLCCLLALSHSAVNFPLCFPLFPPPKRVRGTHCTLGKSRVWCSLSSSSRRDKLQWRWERMSGKKACAERGHPWWG